MFYYLGSYLYYYAIIFIGAITKNTKSSIIIGTLPIIAIALLRGNVGTDTAVYLQQLKIILDAGTYTENFEPAFEYLVLGLGYFAPQPRLLLASLGLLCTLLLFISAYRLEKYPAIFASCILPQFYLDMTMNGVRYGLSFSLVYIAAYYLLSKESLKFWFYLMLASMIQLSGGVLGILLYIVIEKRWRALLYSATFSIICAWIFKDYLLQKLLVYEINESPSSSSGLSPMIVSSLILVTWASEKQLRKKATSLLVSLFTLSNITFVMSRFSYAGLRFQLLVLFLICLSLICHIKKESLKLSSRSIFLLFLIGTLGLGLKLRNFQDGAYQGESPFIPYHFFWDEQPQSGQD